MSKAVCGWCGILAHMPFVENPVSQWWGPQIGETRVMAVHRCANCDARTISFANLVDTEIPESDSAFGDTSVSIQEHAYAERTDQLNWYPPAGIRSRYKHVPASIASAAREAYQCLSFGARRAAVQLARSVVEATAKDKGITVNGIAPKIDEMFSKQLIRKHVRDAAHEVRHLGNDMAHGDFADPVSAEDSGLVLTLMNQVLDEVYEGPGEVAEMQSRRQTRKQQGSA